MKTEVLFEEGEHRWLVLGRDLERRDDVIDTNQYAVLTGDGTILIDPGGIEIFPRMLSELMRFVPIDDIKVLFGSHQDPDIISSLSMWLDLCPDARFYTSWMWKSFVAHFRIGSALEAEEIPDEGMSIPIGPNVSVDAIPAHYCHSSGNFSIWDDRAKILFSGDLGAALLPDRNSSLFVDDFDDHIKYMEAFHRRWMPANRPLRSWVRRVRALEPSMICPQHGSIFRGENVSRFLEWLENLDVEVGVGYETDEER